MSLLEHSVFTMVLQVLALGVVCGSRCMPPRLATWICILSILAFTLPWSQLGTWLGPFTSQGDIAVFSLAGARPVSAVTGGVTILEPHLQALAIGMWLVIAVIWIVWTFLHANAALRRWRSSSSRADALEHLAHDELADLLNTVDVRLVRHSCVAMTSGLRRPTVWLGDAIASDAQQRTALNHELTHVKSGDQYLVVLLTILERALWWNPIVWLLAAEARRQIEYDCDQRCKQLLGASEYKHSLAALSLVKAGIPAIPGALALLNRNGVIERMQRINQSYVTRPAHLIALAVLVGASAIASTVIAGDDLKAKPTLMDCEKHIPDSANWRMSIERDPEKRTLSVSLKDIDALSSDPVPEGSEPYIRCLFSALGIPGEERPRES